MNGYMYGIWIGLAQVVREEDGCYYVVGRGLRGPKRNSKHQAVFRWSQVGFIAPRGA